MVLSWTFDGSGNVWMFFFYFENVAPCDHKGKDKTVRLLTYLHGKHFEFFYLRFTKDKVVMGDGNEFNREEQALIKEFDEK